ncbi:uncharacterized protein yc1106_02689 [Curvularia clavata]|uniref:Mitochondrial inner membrane protease subunit n=1 Tax=Curvularia clavata TaxID=95742 RepID=A0A9Q9DQU1_CURCL|nr:uncharacterized protein yc1106_02689 [Curvularia clavata]
MPPKPPLRLPVKPPAAPRVHVKPSLPALAAKPAARVPPHSKPAVASAPSKAPPPLPSSPSEWPKQSRSGSSSRYVKWGTNGLVAICFLLFLRDHYFELQHVRGSSMAPTLSADAHETGREDYVIVRPFLERSKGRKGEQGNGLGIERGDVVTFWKPHKPSEMGIKRVVAIEGDTVYPTRGYALDTVLRASRMQGFPDGFAEADADSVVPGSQQQELGKVVVPYGHVWIEGDNWRKSLDSNDFGPISKGLIQGKAVKVWRNWFSLMDIGDERKRKESGMRSRVVEGRSEIPAVFLE